MVCLRAALAAFRAAHTDSVLSAGRQTSPLLDLWALADAVDHRAAVPIEALLTTLGPRSVTTARELLASIDEVDGVLAELALA